MNFAYFSATSSLLLIQMVIKSKKAALTDALTSATKEPIALSEKDLHLLDACEVGDLDSVKSDFM
jgi:hypothetical protein